MTKPTLTFTLDRTLDPEGDQPIRMALTLNAWTSREQADVDEGDLKRVLASAADRIGVEVFGDEIALAEKERCGICRFWQPPDEQFLQHDPDVIGQCRKASPVCPQIQAKEKWEHQPPVSGYWPKTKLVDWCGDFQRAAREVEK